MNTTVNNGDPLDFNSLSNNEVSFGAGKPVPRPKCTVLNMAILFDIADRNMNKWFPLDQDKADFARAYNHIWVDNGGCLDCQRLVAEFDQRPETQPNGLPSTHIKHHFLRKIVEVAEAQVIGTVIGSFPGTTPEKLLVLWLLGKKKK
jgi:hypothetical protein